MRFIRSSLVFVLLMTAFASRAAEPDAIQLYRYGQCLLDAAIHYQISPVLIAAIIKTESNHNPEAININISGSEDVGLMQINSEWLPRIAKLGYDRESLFNPCINILVGTWVLAQEVRRFGYTWIAVGAYNAGPSREKESRRAAYAHRVFKNLDD